MNRPNPLLYSVLCPKAEALTGQQWANMANMAIEEQKPN
jgi:hypothetical protein